MLTLKDTLTVMESPNRILVFLDASYLVATSVKITNSKGIDFRFDIEEFKKQSQGLFEITYVLFDKNRQETVQNTTKNILEKSINRFLPNDNISVIENMIKTEIDKRLEEHSILFVQEKEYLTLEDYKQIVEDAENLLPPFSKEKPNEIKDAQILYSISNYLTRHPCNYATFLSHDKDWHNFFESKTSCDILSFTDVLSKIKRDKKKFEINQKLQEATDDIEKHFQTARTNFLNKLDTALQDEDVISYLTSKIIEHFEYNIENSIECIRDEAFEGDVETDDFSVSVDKMTIMEYPELVEPQLNELNGVLTDGYSLIGALVVDTLFKFEFSLKYKGMENVIHDEGEYHNLDNLEGKGHITGVLSWMLTCTDELDTEFEIESCISIIGVTDENLSYTVKDVEDNEGCW